MQETFYHFIYLTIDLCRKQLTFRVLLTSALKKGSHSCETPDPGRTISTTVLITWRSGDIWRPHYERTIRQRVSHRSTSHWSKRCARPAKRLDRATASEITWSKDKSRAWSEILGAGCWTTIFVCSLRTETSRRAQTGSPEFRSRAITNFQAKILASTNCGRKIAICVLALSRARNVTAATVHAS